MDITPKQVLDLAANILATDLVSMAAPHYLKFCVKGVGANITATLTPK